MTSQFPGGVDQITNNVVNATPEVDLHPNLHNQLADAIMAVESSLVVGGSLSLTDHELDPNAHPNLVGIEGPPGPQGPPGPPGASNAAYTGEWAYSNQTAIPPNTGQIRGNTASAATTTLLYLSGTTNGGTDASSFLAAVKVGSDIRVQQKTDSTRWARWTITAAQTNHSTWFEFPVTFLEGSGTAPTNNAPLEVAFLIEGAMTPSGPAGGALSGNYPNPTLAADSVSSANIVDGTVGTNELANLGVTSGKLASGAAASNVGTLGGVLGGTLPNPTMATGAAATNVGTLSGVLTGTLPSPGLAANAVGTTQITDGAITSLKIADGTIATADLANTAVTNAKLGTDTARLNLLTNGGFEIWQRGNGPFTNNGFYTADGWRSARVGTDVLSLNRDTTNVDTGSASAAVCTFTLGTGAGGTIVYAGHTRSERREIFGRTISFSARVRTSTPNAVRIGLGPSTAYIYSTYHTGSGTYETLTVTATVASGEAGEVFAGFFFAASCTAYLDNAMLVVGSVPADYAPLHPADDLARCLRYYEVLGPSAGGTVLVQGYDPAVQTFRAPYRFLARKAVTPTMTKLGTWNVINAGQPTFSGPDLDGFGLVSSSSAGGFSLVYNGSAGCWITAESNP